MAINNVNTFCGKVWLVNHVLNKTNANQALAVTQLLPILEICSSNHDPLSDSSILFNIFLPTLFVLYCQIKIKSKGVLK